MLLAFNCIICTTIQEEKRSLSQRAERGEAGAAAMGQQLEQREGQVRQLGRQLADQHEELRQLQHQLDRSAIFSIQARSKLRRLTLN